jgi:SAM-dependent methyltransferase
VAKTWKTILIYKIMDKEIARCAKTYMAGKLIDIGCGVKPYEKIIAPYVQSYTGSDRPSPFSSASKVDLVGTADRIPVEDASFDTAISTATLEHLSDPEDALKECYRVLKKRSFAIYTVPFFWHLHGEPWDYYRFTKYGLRHIFEKVGFEIVEITPLSGFWTTTTTLFCYYIERFNIGPLRYIPIIPAIGIFLQSFAYLFDRIDNSTEWTWMYLVVAEKK